jgi:hypothetical protein
MNCSFVDGAGCENDEALFYLRSPVKRFDISGGLFQNHERQIKSRLTARTDLIFIMLPILFRPRTVKVLFETDSSGFLEGMTK